MLKSSGESGDPCGTPCVGVKVCVDVAFSCLMLIMR